jgi:hypothetical protein
MFESWEDLSYCNAYEKYAYMHINSVSYFAMHMQPVSMLFFFFFFAYPQLHVIFHKWINL